MAKTSRPSDPVDFEIFTGDEFHNFLTGLSNFSPGSNLKTMMADVKGDRGWTKWTGISLQAYILSGVFPPGFFTQVEVSGALFVDYSPISNCRGGLIIREGRKFKSKS